MTDALRYATIATDAFRDIYGEDSEHTINAQFLALSISYTLKNPKVRDLFEKLFEALMKRDRAANEENSRVMLPPVAGRNGKDSDWLEKRISQIKELCIACIIMEMTRSLSMDDK